MSLRKDPGAANNVRLFKIRKNLTRLADRLGFAISVDEKGLFLDNPLEPDYRRFAAYYSAKALSTERIHEWEPEVSSLDRDFRQALSSIYSGKTNENDKLIVYFAVPDKKSETKIGSAIVTKFTDEMMKLNTTKTAWNITRIIFVAPGKELSSTAAKSGFDSLMFEKTLYFDHELLVDPLTSYLAATYEPITDSKSIRETIESHGSMSENIMAINDPISKYYNLKPGDIVRIYNTNLDQKVLGAYTIAYRMVSSISSSFG